MFPFATMVGPSREPDPGALGVVTPLPVYETPPPPVKLGDRCPVPMEQHEKMRIRAAAFRATRLYPGPVGELISRELLAWEEFGYRIARDGVILRLVDHVMTASHTAEPPTRDCTERAM